MDGLRLLTLTLAVAALAPVSCDVESNPVSSRGEGRRAEVSFVAEPRTKASASAERETNILSLDLLAFRLSDGMLDGYSRMTSGGNTVSCRLSVGAEVRYYVVANAPANVLNAYVTENGFLQGRTRLSYSTGESFVMVGSGILDVSDGNVSVPVALDRYVSKVTLASVQVGWLDAYPPGTDFRIGRVALINACGDMPWSGTPQAGEVWYNRNGKFEKATDDLAVINGLLVAGPLNIPVTDGGMINIGAELYAMPNPVDNDVNSEDAPEWSLRDTRLVLELIVEGSSCWYPVDLPAMQPNRQYAVRNMILNGEGSSHPDKPISRTNISFGVDVLAWGEEAMVIDF